MLKKIYEYIKDDEFRYTIFNNRIHIVNFESIKTLNNSEVLIKSNNTIIKVKGKNLFLNKLLDNEALIIGKVLKIEVIYE